MTFHSCWALSEGHAGMENQCIGLAEAMGLTPEVKRVRFRFPWTRLPAGLWPFPFRAAAGGSDALEPPWPDVLITCGRRSVPLALAIRQQSGGKTFTVHIQNPTVPPSAFHMIVAPEHDGLTGPNVHLTHGALHRVTTVRMKDDAEKFAPLYASLPRPLAGVLVGGSNRRYRMGRKEMADLGDKLRQLHEESGAGLAVTASRRTDAATMGVLREKLAGVPAVFWPEVSRDVQDRKPGADSGGEFDKNPDENPYYGILGLADLVVVTCDSISMVSEACASAKPVLVMHFPGGSKRFHRFHRAMEKDGYTRPFIGRFESWTPPLLDDVSGAVAAVRAAFLAHMR